MVIKVMRVQEPHMRSNITKEKGIVFVMYNKGKGKSKVLD